MHSLVCPLWQMMKWSYKIKSIYGIIIRYETDGLMFLISLYLEFLYLESVVTVLLLLMVAVTSTRTAGSSSFTLSMFLQFKSMKVTH